MSTATESATDKLRTSVAERLQDALKAVKTG